jgi:hypothetical protein
MPTFADRGVSHGQCGGSPTAIISVRLGQSAASKMKEIPLSNDMVQRWIWQKIQKRNSLKKFKKSKLFALQLEKL